MPVTKKKKAVCIEFTLKKLIGLYILVQRKRNVLSHLFEKLYGNSLSLFKGVRLQNSLRSNDKR